MKKLAVYLAMGIVLLPRLTNGEVLSVEAGAVSVPASVQVLDNQNHPLQTFLSNRQTYSEPVSLSDISPFVLLAVQAAEDRRFYKHHGIDFRAVLRAVWQNVRWRGIVSGASTITQQLVRALHPRPKNWRNKWIEAWDAWQLERKYSKDKILQQYLNILEFGNHTQGIEAAARFYFGVPASELSVAQSALLAGLIQSPTRLNPLKNPDGALARRNRVLQAMYRNRFITQEDYHLALSEPLVLQAATRPVQAPHFSRLISRLSSPGEQVQTFLDADLQQYAETTLQRHVNRLAEEHVTNAAAVVLDNQTGAVLAYVGSADFDDAEHAGQVDGVLAKRQPGSALKPFVYALALENGFTAASILQDEDTFFEGGFRPRNYDGKFHGGVSVRRALANSYNVPVVRVAETLGAARILQELHAFGFASLNHPAEFYGLGIALGGGEVTLLELANAYSALARGGLVKQVVFAREPRLQSNTTSVRAVPEEISYIITDILADNAARADAFGLNSALQFPFPAAAKTGTSKDYKDNFAIGYTPRITVAVWAGNFDGSSMQKVSGVTGAAPILHDILVYANKRYPGGPFVKPYGVLSARICTHSGRLAGENCTATREELFTAGTVPTQICDGTHENMPAPLQFIFPVRGDVFVYDKSLPSTSQQLHIQVAAQAPCSWQLNGQPLPETEPDFWWPLQKGKFDLTVTCSGQTAQTFFTVL